MAEVDRLLDDYTHHQIAAILNRKGVHTIDDRPLTRMHIRYIQETYDLASRYDRLRDRGMLTIAELAKRFNVAPATVKSWNQAGFLKSHLYNDKNECLFESPGEGTLVKGKHKGLMIALHQMRLSRKLTSQHQNEVQYEA